MELKEIFPGVLWSVKYVGDDLDIFSKRMFQWRSVEFIEDYIIKHKSFIENDPYWSGFTVESVINSTKRDVSRLLKYCIELYNNTRNGLHPDFSDRFHVLENPPYNEKKIARRKLYGRSE